MNPTIEPSVFQAFIDKNAFRWLSSQGRGKYLQKKAEAMDSHKRIAIQAAKKAGFVLRDRLGQKRKIGYKGAVNLVTEMDILSEKIIVAEIQKNFPDHAILAE